MIEYAINPALSADDFIDILKRSTLGERRPIDDRGCMKAMIEHADVIVIAKDKEKIVGIARSVTDYSYCCYLSDLAVDHSYQSQGIGKMLISKTQECLEASCKIILLSAPKAVGYYPKLGFDKHPAAYVLAKKHSL